MKEKAENIFVINDKDDEIEVEIILSYGNIGCCLYFANFASSSKKSSLKAFHFEGQPEILRFMAALFEEYKKSSSSKKEIFFTPFVKFLRKKGFQRKRGF